MIVKMSLAGLMTYDNTLFDDLTLPDGIDKDGFIDVLMSRHGSLNVGDMNPDIMKAKIAIWGHSHYWTFRKLLATLNFEYNPIWNKDGEITETEEGTENESDNTVISDSIVSEGTDDITRSTNATISENGHKLREMDGTDNRTTSASGTRTTNNTSVNSAIAYDASGYTDREKLSDNGGGTESSSGTDDLTKAESESENSQGTRTETGGGTEGIERNNTTTRDGSTDRTRARTSGASRTRIEKGNIGVTTTQQMIKEEREISMFNLYNLMADSFAANLLILLY